MGGVANGEVEQFSGSQDKIISRKKGKRTWSRKTEEKSKDKLK